MKNKKHCPNCSSELHVIEETAYPLAGFFTQAVSTEIALVALAGIGGSIYFLTESVAIFIAVLLGLGCSYFVYSAKAKKSIVYGCNSCKSHFQGEALRPFSYAGQKST